MFEVMATRIVERRRLYKSNLQWRQCGTVDAGVMFRPVKVAKKEGAITEALLLSENLQPQCGFRVQLWASIRLDLPIWKVATHQRCICSYRRLMSWG